MSAAPFPLDLEGKTESAIIAFLGRVQQAAGCVFRRQADEQPKENGIIVVSAVRAGEVVPVSGIFRLTVEIELVLRVRRNAGNSLATFAGICNAIGESLQIHPAILADALTKERTDWRCYIAELVGVDKKPREMSHRAAWSLQIEASGVSSAIANRLHPATNKNP
jgi:hypothetical protein